MALNSIYNSASSLCYYTARFVSGTVNAARQIPAAYGKLTSTVNHTVARVQNLPNEVANAQARAKEAVKNILQENAVRYTVAASTALYLSPAALPSAILGCVAHSYTTQAVTEIARKHLRDDSSLYAVGSRDLVNQGDVALAVTAAFTAIAAAQFPKYFNTQNTAVLGTIIAAGLNIGSTVSLGANRVAQNYFQNQPAPIQLDEIPEIEEEQPEAIDQEDEANVVEDYEMVDGASDMDEFELIDHPNE